MNTSKPPSSPALDATVKSKMKPSTSSSSSSSVAVANVKKAMSALDDKPKLSSSSAFSKSSSNDGPTFVHPLGDPKSKVICKTCFNPEKGSERDYFIVPYFDHRVSDRVFLGKSQEKGSVVWVSACRSHVRVLMDKDKWVLDKTKMIRAPEPKPGPIMAGGKFRPTREPLTTSVSILVAESIKKEFDIMERPVNKTKTSALGPEHFGGEKTQSNRGSLSSSRSERSLVRASGDTTTTRDGSQRGTGRAAVNVEENQGNKGVDNAGIVAGGEKQWVKAMVPVHPGAPAGKGFGSGSTRMASANVNVGLAPATPSNNKVAVPGSARGFSSGTPRLGGHNGSLSGRRANTPPASDTHRNIFG